MAVSQSLSVTEVAGSTNTAANTSMVAIIWDSTQTGDSWNGYTKTAKYYISINGGPETEYTVSYTLPKNATQRILSKTITVTHKDDGSGSVKVRTWMDTGISAGVVEKSKTIDLRTIPRASTITTIANKSLGNSCIVAWTPLSSTYRYKLQFSLKGWLHTTDVIHPNQTTAYNYILNPLPLEVANQFSADSKEGTLEVRLLTYSDSAATTQVGSTSKKEFTVTLPDNSSTKPTVTMSLAPVHSLSSKFASVYVQGKSKVQATLSATGKYQATVASSAYKMSVLGKNDTAYPYQSDYLTNPGTVTVTGYATDSRGFTGTTSQKITVIPYSKPKIIPASGESSVICARCDANGNLSESGEYLKIKAKRSYSKVESGTQLNFCAIRYRCKPSTNASFSDSDWVTILAKNSTNDEIATGPIANVVSNASVSYIVEIGVVDDVGESSSLKITVPTSSVDFHLKKGGGGAAFGKYAEKDKCLEIAPDWDVTGRVYGLGKCKEIIPQNADINSYTEFGVYSIVSNDYAATMSNLPIKLAGLLIVSSAVGDGNSSGPWAYIKQRYESLDGKHEYHRIVRTGSVAGVYTYDEWLRRGNTNWRGLTLSSSVSQSNHAIGRYTNGNCWYRVVDENHVYVTFNCAFTFSGSEIQVNANALPAEYRPARYVYAMCPTNDRGIARIIINTSGNVFVDYVQSMASSSVTSSYGVTWIDGYIDYWI